MQLLITDKLKERFFKRVIKTDYCWDWVGNKNKYGYGIFLLSKKETGLEKSLRMRAHRFSYLLHYGELDESLLGCHKCDNPSCVNPLHIFLGTHKDNSDDCTSKNRQRFQKMQYCKNGHPRSSKTTIKNGNKTRCIICQKNYMAKKEQNIKNDFKIHESRKKYRRIWAGKKLKDDSFKKRINKKAVELRIEKERNMTPDEYKIHRESINKRARDNYWRRKNGI